MQKFLMLAAGGVTGTLARFSLAGLIQRACGAAFPYGTFVVNMSGCFLMGLLAVVADGRRGLSPEARLLLMTGFCGAYTTFSTFVLETFTLMRDGNGLQAAANVAGSVAIGLVVFRLGMAAGELF